jgi:hypothetical protein
MVDYIEFFKNPARRHNSLGFLTPNEYEDLHLSKTQPGFSQAWSAKRGSGHLKRKTEFEPATLILAEARCWF